ncbi:MAG: paraquat-inducible protein A [Planctomycetaceae bacterium]|nr:paraquat-inducible protein A [Planctomycetaceae bacterium]
MSHLKSCHCCGLVQTAPDGVRAACARCATKLGSWLGPDWGNELSAAFALAALILYVPAMWLPFLRIERLGHAHASSLLGGVRTLLADGHWLVGLIVLLFSIVLPVIKLTALLLLAQRRWRLAHRNRAVVYRLVEHLGRWGMLDVLLVAVMVAFVKLGGLVEFHAGAGLLTFASFVLLSLCASALFDPFELWDEGLSLAQNPEPASTSGAQPAEHTQVMAHEVPAAMVTPPPRRRWVWLIPVVAVLVTGWLIASVVSQRGRLIALTFREGHGIAAGAELKYHGIVCGEVETVRLSDDLTQVHLEVRLTPEADGLARDGARFWIVRPQADLTGIAGLETLVGAKYLTLLPGNPQAQRVTSFVGLDEPPVLDLEVPGGLEIVLQSPGGAGLRTGVGVHYRDQRIGGVVSTGLAGDGSAIETRVYVRPQFSHLVREGSLFWNDSGIRLRGGLTELSLHIGTAETLLRGGVAMSLPPDPGEAVAAGHRFILHSRPEQEWLDWQPAVTGAQPVLDGALPKLVQATLQWTHDGLFFDRDRELRGWLLATEEGWSGPLDLLSVPDDALDGRATLTIGEEPITLSSDAVSTREPGFGVLPYEQSREAVTVPPVRTPQVPEDCVLVTGPDASPLFVAAVRCRRVDGVWLIDEALPVSSALHGAACIAVADGALVGRVLCSDDSRVIVLSTPAND